MILYVVTPVPQHTRKLFSFKAVPSAKDKSVCFTLARRLNSSYISHGDRRKIISSARLGNSNNQRDVLCEPSISHANFTLLLRGVRSKLPYHLHPPSLATPPGARQCSSYRSIEPLCWSTACPGVISIHAWISSASAQLSAQLPQKWDIART